ncbi:MAG: hypothetical protein PVH89_10815 [Gammaproteobacteria bacterium]|jgi:hypothetical protein
MRKVPALVLAVMASLLTVATAFAQSMDEIIAEAVLPLPEDLRAGATVYRYDPETGSRVVLRQGTNHVECHPKNLDGFTWCYPIATAARRDLSARLMAEGVSDAERAEAVAAAEAAGEIEPTPFGSILYRLYDGDDRIRLLWVVVLPGATSDELGMPTASQRDPSLAGQGLPWMMEEGTPQAHLMIPINGTQLSNRGGAATRLDTKAIDDPVVQAVLPLPEALRNDATVFTYDEATGERIVLRRGSNGIECQPRNPETGFTRCYQEWRGAELDLRARLNAQGRSEAEIAAALAAAREDGSIESTPFGSLAYRLYEEDDRLKLLWILSLPDAMPGPLGMPTGPQRDQSLAGRGRPWMMREGTPAAHLMIPINSTELSN